MSSKSRSNSRERSGSRERADSHERVQSRQRFHAARLSAPRRASALPSASPLARLPPRRVCGWYQVHVVLRRPLCRSRGALPAVTGARAGALLDASARAAPLVRIACRVPPPRSPHAPQLCSPASRDGRRPEMALRAGATATLGARTVCLRVPHHPSLRLGIDRARCGALAAAAAASPWAREARRHRHRAAE